MALTPQSTHEDELHGDSHTSSSKYAQKDAVEAGVNTCIAFLFGIVGFAFSVVLFYYTPLGLLGIIASLFFCLFYSYRAHDKGGSVAVGFLIVAADIAFIIGMAIRIVSSVGP